MGTLTSCGLAPHTGNTAVDLPLLLLLLLLNMDEINYIALVVLLTFYWWSFLLNGNYFCF